MRVISIHSRSEWYQAIFNNFMSSEIERIKKYVRAANYLSAGQIYLEGNFLLKEKLSFDHIKTRLLGHWGTTPGINFVYACLNNLINKTGANMMFVLGPGHGFPAVQANSFLEGTLGKYYPEAQKNENGIGSSCTTSLGRTSSRAIQALRHPVSSSRVENSVTRFRPRTGRFWTIRTSS